MNNRKRLKGTRDLVKDILEAHPDWNAPKIYQHYLAMIGDINKAVTLNAIQKHIEVLRPLINKMDKSKPWHLGTLDVLHLSPEVLPELCRLNLEYQVQRKRPLTIHEAEWASRIYPMIRGLPDNYPKISILDLLLRVYIRLARLAALSELDYPDTTEVDNVLIETITTNNPYYLYFHILKWSRADLKYTDEEKTAIGKYWSKFLEDLLLDELTRNKHLKSLKITGRVEFNSGDDWLEYGNALAGYGVYASQEATKKIGPKVFEDVYLATRDKLLRKIPKVKEFIQQHPEYEVKDGEVK